MFEFSAVELTKNGKIVLDELNFGIDSNCLIVGNSGSGKTTLLEALVGKIMPAKGKISHKGKIVLAHNDYRFNKLLGSAFLYYQQRFNSQDAEIGPSLREVLQEQIIPVGTIDLKSVDIKPPKYTEFELETICKRLNIFHLLDTKITSLSNGETRRSFLAHALLQKPDILLLDNPFIGLDVKTRDELNKIFHELSEIQIVLTVSNLKEIPDIFSKYIYLENGKATVFDDKNDIPNPYHEPIKLAMPKAVNPDFEIAFKITNGRVKYGDKLVLKNVDWQINKAEKWAIIGPNGSGKSSLMSLIIGDNPQCYSNDIVIFDKKRGSGESIWDIKSKIGFVSPELQQYFDKNTLVWKTVASGFFDTIGLFRKLSDKQNEILNEYLGLFNLNEIKDLSLNKLSAGQQRLVFLARALVKNPPLLVLDEPCQNLDQNQIDQFKEIINQVIENSDITLIYITHYDYEIPDAVNHFMYLQAGEIKEIVNK